MIFHKMPQDATYYSVACAQHLPRNISVTILDSQLAWPYCWIGSRFAFTDMMFYCPEAFYIDFFFFFGEWRHCKQKHFLRQNPNTIYILRCRDQHSVSRYAVTEWLILISEREKKKSTKKVSRFQTLIANGKTKNTIKKTLSCKSG